MVLREVTTDVLTSEILTGEIDTAYATYMGYDEIAHHSGVEDENVWGALKKIDHQFSKLASVSGSAGCCKRTVSAVRFPFPPRTSM